MFWAFFFFMWFHTTWKQLVEIKPWSCDRVFSNRKLLLAAICWYLSYDLFQTLFDAQTNYKKYEK